MYSRSMHRESKTHLCSCTHTYTHPLNSLCTRNHHSFTAIPVELASFRSFSSHDRFLSIYYNKIVVPKRSICVSIYLSFYTATFCPRSTRLFIRWYIYKLVDDFNMKSAYSICWSFYVRSRIDHFTVRSLATKAQNIRNRFFLKCFFLSFLSFDDAWRSIGEEYLEREITNSWNLVSSKVDVRPEIQDSSVG